MSLHPVHLLLCLLLTITAAPASAQNPDSPDPHQQAAQLLLQTQVRGGLIVHSGCGNGTLTLALRQSDSFQVHGLESDPALVEQARSTIRAAGLYGDVSVIQHADPQLPYTDNSVNLLIADNGSTAQREEILRVLVPNGQALLRQTDGQWQQLTKPRPDSIDEWSHYLHDASGNAVAHDTVVNSPRHLQWVGSPRWSRHHDRMASMSALVSTNGRMFYIMDEGSRI
ncbi:MAG: class I SAM-dependent methyltransferase, partial [Planctomycetaceae bacterium]